MRDSVFGVVSRGASLIEVADDRGESLLADGLLIEDGIPAVARMRGARVRRWLVDCAPSEEAIVTMLHDTPANISLSVRRCVSPISVREAGRFLRVVLPALRLHADARAAHLLSGMAESVGSVWQDVGGSHGDQVVALGGDLIVVSESGSNLCGTEEAAREPDWLRSRRLSS